ncbi:MAG: hypothetical protein IJZ77_02715 [Bacilli bacterium]|nr:hypothetical protein [Bacilli bacterium]
MASINILKYLKRKKSGSYETPIYIGAEQRFISALRGTNNNNLEEQSILGLDCITTSYWEGTTFYERKEFHNGTKTNGFYILESRFYNAAADSQFLENMVQFSTDQIYFAENDTLLVIESDEAEFESQTNTVSIPQAINKDDSSNLPETDEDEFRKSREDVLYYKNASNTLIEVSMKTTWEKEADGVTTTKSIIENKL